MLVVSMVEGGGDTDSDYNDVQFLDTPSDMSVSDHAMHSSAAINDNLLNAQRQLHRNE